MGSLPDAPAGHLEGSSGARVSTRAVPMAWEWTQRLTAVVLLVVVAPVMVVLALLVRTTSRGPVLFRQRRVGQYGRPFVIYKFRTMRVGAEHELLDSAATRDVELAPFMKVVADPRVTPLGRVLRATSLDELPQLLNVVRGEMNLVGPRPLVTYESALCPPETWRRLLVKPGVTGLWQVSGRSDLPLEEALALDSEYVRTRSLTGDAQILVRTLAVPFHRRGAL